MTCAEIKDALYSAAAFVRRGWCKNALAKDRLGRTVGSRDPSAVAWCALGAIEKICGGPQDGCQARYALRNIVFMDVEIWNDHYARDGEQVARKLEEAAKYLK